MTKRPQFSSALRDRRFRTECFKFQTRKSQKRIEMSYEILRAAPKRPISAQYCDLWTRKSGCAALRMTRVRSLRMEVNRAISDLKFQMTRTATARKNQEQNADPSLRSG